MLTCFGLCSLLLFLLFVFFVVFSFSFERHLGRSRSGFFWAAKFSMFGFQSFHFIYEFVKFLFPIRFTQKNGIGRPHPKEAEEGSTTERRRKTNAAREGTHHPGGGRRERDEKKVPLSFWVVLFSLLPSFWVAAVPTLSSAVPPPFLGLSPFGWC